MAGKIKKMIDKIVQEKSNGNQIIANSVRTKLILKGVAINKYTAVSADEPDVMAILSQAAKEFGVTL